jgi:protein gp37
MGISKIEWTTYSFNAWRGCAKVDSGCKNCYAERDVSRWGISFGVNAARKINESDAYWNAPLAWNARAAKDEIRYRVFTNSESDLMEDNPQVTAAREKLWALIKATPNLDWLILTKRPENFAKFLPWVADNTAPWPNVWLGTSVAEAQEKQLERIAILRATPAAIKFVSAEPLLGDLGSVDLSGIDWLIAGGESGPGSRECDLQWIANLVEQCKAQGVKVFVKQLGQNPVYENLPFIVLNSKSQRSSKGGELEEFPPGLQIREYPAVA